MISSTRPPSLPSFDSPGYSVAKASGFRSGDTATTHGSVSSGNVSTHASGAAPRFRGRARVPENIHAAALGGSSDEEEGADAWSRAGLLCQSTSTLSRDSEEKIWSHAASLCRESSPREVWSPGADQELYLKAAAGSRDATDATDHRKQSSGGDDSHSPTTEADKSTTDTHQGDGNLLTSSMFTKEDIDAITPLQIANYLTMKQREKIGTKALCSKLKKGFSLADDKEVCDTCSMPKLRKEGRTVEKCVVCPALKKRVLKEILNGCC